MALTKNKAYLLNSERTVKEAGKELSRGLQLLDGIDHRIVSVFGSHLAKPRSKPYQQCKELACLLGQQGYAIITGGGPGIMEAANAGAKAAGVPSIGFKAKLLQNEQISKHVHTKVLSFKYLFVRRFVLSIKSDALIFYPGGFGTLNELYEYIVLMQTKMADTVPLICMNKAFWKGLFSWTRGTPLRHKYLSKKDLALVHFADSTADVVRILKKAKR